MTPTKLRFLFTLLLFSSLLTRAQNIDSLWSVYKNIKNPDSIRFEAFNDIAWTLLYTNPDSTYLLGQEALERAREKKYKKWEAKSLNTIGASFQIKGDYLKAIDFYQQSLKITEQLNDKKGLSASLSNIGSIYLNIGESEKALEYLHKSLPIFIEIGNKQGEASALNNIGIIYNLKRDYSKALVFNSRSLKTYEEIGDKQGIAAANANLGNICSDMGSYDKALLHQSKSLKLYQEIGDKQGISTTMSNMGKSYLKQKKYSLALEYLEKAKKISVETEDLSSEKEAMFITYQTYKAIGNTANALKSYERYIIIRDTLFKEENQREITRKGLQFEYDKRMAEDSVKHAEAQKVKDALIFVKEAQIDQDKTQKRALYGGLLLLLISGGVMYNRFRIIRKQKQIIELKSKETEEQKLIIEQKQMEILSSISYAKRLQEAVLPPQSLIDKHLSSSFIFYKPKDIVAGDFYWMEIVRDKSEELILFAAADCTGHGVPGAMVSMVCSNALNRAVKEFGVTLPGEILDKVLELVTETFERSEEEVKDGMDISLCSLNKRTGTLQWAGANNPLWIIRNKKLIELKPTKQSIGKIDLPLKYNTETFQLMSGDIIYLFTDGYADQFGGSKGKKYKYSQLQEFLLSIANEPLHFQITSLDIALKNWKGKLEQVDDILIIGVKF
ncbi:MAG: protein serine/threonine phosphatase [Bacteroidetes bacterium]|nr:protein serine/threonine phosphatase [Bacteroidota bacterium]